MSSFVSGSGVPDEEANMFSDQTADLFTSLDSYTNYFGQVGPVPVFNSNSLVRPPLFSATSVVEGTGSQLTQPLTASVNMGGVHSVSAPANVGSVHSVSAPANVGSVHSVIASVNVGSVHSVSAPANVGSVHSVSAPANVGSVHSVSAPANMGGVHSVGFGDLLQAAPSNEQSLAQPVNMLQYPHSNPPLQPVPKRRLLSEDSEDSVPLSNWVPRNVSAISAVSPQPAEFQQAPAVVATKKQLQRSPRRRKQRDPNEPQRPVSAYALFFRDTQAAIKSHNPGATFGQVSRIVASMWEALESPKKMVYKNSADEAKSRYMQEMASYKASLTNPTSVSSSVQSVTTESIPVGDYANPVYTQTSVGNGIGRPALSTGPAPVTDLSMVSDVSQQIPIVPAAHQSFCDLPHHKQSTPQFGNTQQSSSSNFEAGPPSTITVENFQQTSTCNKNIDTLQSSQSNSSAPDAFQSGTTENQPTQLGQFVTNPCVTSVSYQVVTTPVAPVQMSSSTPCQTSGTPVIYTPVAPVQMPSSTPCQTSGTPFVATPIAPVQVSSSTPSQASGTPFVATPIALVPVSSTRCQASGTPAVTTSVAPVQMSSSFSCQASGIPIVTTSVALVQVSSSTPCQASGTPVVTTSGAPVQVSSSTPSQASGAPVVASNGTVRTCSRPDCNNVAVPDPEWDNEYCSSKCVVVHCNSVFSEWVIDRQASHQQSSLQV